MSARVNRKGAMLAIACRAAFVSHTGNLRGEWHGDTYRVYSYAFPLATYADDGGWAADFSRSSITTAHHLGIVRRALGWDVSRSTLAAMRSIGGLWQVNGGAR
jgi:hypothetical protein